MLDPRERRTFLARVDQRTDRLVLALGEDLDAAVAQVAHPADQSEPLCGTHRPVAKADALHPSRHKDTLCRHKPLHSAGNSPAGVEFSTAAPRVSRAWRRFAASEARLAALALV